MLLSRLDLAIVLFAAAVLGSTACSGRSPGATPTSSDEATQPPAGTITTAPSGPTPFNTRPVPIEVASAMQFIDARSGVSQTLYQSTTDPAFGARFDGDVFSGAFSNSPPLMAWNAAGTHLLVVWPNSPRL